MYNVSRSLGRPVRWFAPLVGATLLLAACRDGGASVGPRVEVTALSNIVAAKSWTPVDLGFVPTAIGSVASGISRGGALVGWDYVTGLTWQAWARRPNGTKIILQPLPGDVQADPSGVSDVGIASGTSRGGAFGPYRPVFWMGNAVAKPIPGVPDGQTYHVSQNGTIVGDSFTHSLGFRYRPGGTVEFLQPDTSYPFTKGYAINDLGYVAGESNGPVVWAPGSAATRIVPPAGYFGGAAVDINNRGDVVGYFSSATIVWNAFVKLNGQPVQFLQPPVGRDVTFAFAIDRFGNVYGWAAPNQPGSTYTDIIWVAGTPTPLPQLPGLNGYAQDVNECGAMAGSGYDGSFYHIMKWTTTC